MFDCRGNKNTSLFVVGLCTAQCTALDHFGPNLNLARFFRQLEHQLTKNSKTKLNKKKIYKAEINKTYESIWLHRIY